MALYAAKQLKLQGVAVVPQARAAPSPPPEGIKETWGGPAFPCEGQSFVQAYRAANNQRDPLTYAVNFYDAVHLIAHAMQQAGSTDPAKVAEAMQKGSYKGAAGTYEFDNQRDLKSSPVTVFTFKGGQPSAVTSY